MDKRLENLFEDEDECDDFYNDIVQALLIREQIYLEIGVKAGAKLMLQMLSEKNT